MSKKASPKFSLTINKRKINFNVGLGFLSEYQELHQETHGDIDVLFENCQRNPIYYVPKLMYLSALYESRGELDFDERDLKDLIDVDISPTKNVCVDFFNLFYEHTYKDVPEEEEDTSKNPKKK